MPASMRAMSTPSRVQQPPPSGRLPASSLRAALRSRPWFLPCPSAPPDQRVDDVEQLVRLDRLEDEVLGPQAQSFGHLPRLGNRPRQKDEGLAFEQGLGLHAAQHVEAV